LDHHVVLDPDQPAPEYERLWAGAFDGGQRRQTTRDWLTRRLFKQTSTDDRVRARAGGKMNWRLRLAVDLAQPLDARPNVDVLVVKSVNAALSAEWIWKRFQPRVVVVTRDLRNVVASWQTIGFGGSAELSSAMRAEAMRRWSLVLPATDDTIERTTTICAVLLLALHDGLRAHPEWTCINHEESMDDAEGALERAAESVGIAWSEAARRFVNTSNRAGTGYSTNRLARELPDQWKDRLDTEQKAAIDRVLAAIPEHMWYTANS
jgi:hypothetical protein